MVQYCKDISIDFLLIMCVYWTFSIKLTSDGSEKSSASIQNMIISCFFLKSMNTPLALYRNSSFCVHVDFFRVIVSWSSRHIHSFHRNFYEMNENSFS